MALKKDENAGAVYIAWMCSSPENNPVIVDEVQYSGVGGHLFAIAMQKSMEFGQNGAVYGFAANLQLLHHYMKVFHASHIGILHKYQFAIDESYSKLIMEEYNYDWTDEEI